jgi:protein FAM32A
MPSDEYAAAIGGGLKLKGAKPAGIEKKKKKNKTTDKVKEAQLGGALERSRSGSEVAVARKVKDKDERSAKAADIADEDEEEDLLANKTEAERRYEEMRRRRLEERLQKEGVKTHKERVEELNGYLSRLSEHHDMPRIGPG